MESALPPTKIGHFFILGGTYYYVCNYYYVSYYYYVSTYYYVSYYYYVKNYYYVTKDLVHKFY